ncbi:ACP S-malonyltransferase [Nocardiopsis ansamitocini]|uniref:Malonyl CoA-acyl carrier protein transacylase n=1 Tax=Nocardiopsis ansamitocini TaxID=1670832 RepID=A0A9W6UJB9_9ACTN|nr:ACP S-malonyltransferase [Nocardiopsis ansamitocini]GLU48664.1 malonyl CoA-acyl carrier protein transacylase [Nocardiopsis ansamitocini]
MESIAFIFPGQGSQRVGMGTEFHQRAPDLADTYYRTADEILGFSLSDLCRNASAQTLRDTSITQPAVFLTSLVALELLRDHAVAPDVVAGHSLGEFTALVCAGALEWTDALSLVRRRGELMKTVNEKVPGTMAAVLGLEKTVVEAACSEALVKTGEIVEVANDNGPDQVVVSGQVRAVEELIQIARSAGARRVVPLGVGAPFHCSLLREIEEEFAEVLEGTDFRDPTIPVISSVTAEPLSDAHDIIRILRRQLTAPVRWRETVIRMSHGGAEKFVEVGPGRVLTGLCRTILPTAQTYTTATVDECEKTTAALAKAEL